MNKQTSSRFVRKERFVLMNMFLLIITAALVIVSPALHAEPLDNWHWRNPIPPPFDLSRIAYGNNAFVAVGASGTVITSPDGITWTIRTSGTANALSGVTYAQSIFIAVGATGTILTSSDGVTWTSRTSGTANTLNSVACGNGTFVAVGGSGTVLTSTDGITWAGQVSGTANALNGVTYSAGMFVASGNAGTIITSANGTVWTTRVSGTANALNDVAYGGNNYVAVGGSGTILLSSDGITWNSSASGPTASFSGVTYNGSFFVAVGSAGTIETSIDGFIWTKRTTETSNALYGIVYGNNTFVAVGITGTVLSSSNGSTWSNRGMGVTSTLNGLSYGNDTFVAVGGFGAVRTSPDGVVWTNRSSGITNTFSGVTFDGSFFVAVGGAGEVATTSDGVTWTRRDSGTSNTLNSVVHGNGLFVAVGTSGTVLTSADGVTWTGRTSGSTSTLNSVTYGNNLYVAAGVSGMLITSSDGIVWTNRNSGTTNDLNGVTYGNGKFVAVGTYGYVATSSDGIVWTARNSVTTRNFNCVAYANNNYVAVGVSGTIMSSPDGIAWTSKTSGTANAFNAIISGGNTFVAAGTSDTVVQSDSVPAPPFLGNIPSPSSSDFGAVRITNTSNSSVAVKGILYDQTGAILGNGNVTLTSSLAANETKRFTPSELAGVVGASSWTGGARLEITSPASGIVLVGTYRSYNGTMTNMSNATAESVYNLPGSGNADQAYVRVTNKSDISSVQVKGTLYHKNGSVLGNADSTLIPSLAPKETKVLSMSDMERLVNCLTWTNRARLDITAPSSGVTVMGVIRTITGTMENVSSAIGDNKVYHIPGSLASDVGYVRVTNTTDSAVEVRGTVYKLDGTIVGTANAILVPSLASKETVLLSAADLESRVGSSPLSNSVRLEITAPSAGLVVMGWIMNASGDLVNMSDIGTSDLYFIPGSTSADAGYIRITNTSGSSVQVRGTLYALNGSVMGAANSVLVLALPAKATSRLSVADLAERVGAALATGNYRLHITSPTSNVVLMETMRNSTGPLTNMTGSVGY